MNEEPLTLKQFLRQVKDQNDDQPARPFCFILGSGASIQSGIPTGKGLVDLWLKVLHQDADEPKAELAKWATAANLSIPDFDYSRREEFYGQVYAKRFPGPPRFGHAEIQKLLSGKEPSFGYSILAHILANKQHKVVITTNFDNLVADALFLYSRTAPLQCNHENLASFITPQLDRPLVVKIHRDFLFHPRSAAGDITDLDPAWVKPLTDLLRHFTPIFIGYGGNDGSLMGYLETLDKDFFDGLYWCVWRNDPPNERVKSLLAKHQGALVSIPGFDELMLHLMQTLGIPNPVHDLQKHHEERVKRFTKQLTDLGLPALDASKAEDATPEAKDLGEAASAAIKQLPIEDTPDFWILRAQAELDKDKAEALYREALEKHPENGDLMCAFGEFLAKEKQAYEEAEALIRGAYEADPENPDRLHDYGTFLWYSLSKGRQAEPLLRQALVHRTDILGLEHPDTLMSRNNLAAALHLEGKYAEAEEENRAMLVIREHVLGTEHPDTLNSRNNLAVALSSQGKYAEAEVEHRAVLSIRERVLGAEHPDTLSNRNNLSNSLNAQGKYAEAEAGHREVLVIRERVLGAEHPDTLSCRNNLAADLSSQSKDAAAEEEYRAVLAIQERVLGAEHPDALRSRNNLSNSLNAQGKYAEAEAGHLEVLVIRERVQGAEHPDTLSSRNNLANALAAQGKYAEAEEEYRAVLAIQERVLGAEHPHTLRSLFNLALNQEDQGQLPEALALMQRAEAGRTKVLGLNHPVTQDAQRIRKRIQRKMKKPKGKKPRK